MSSDIGDSCERGASQVGGKCGGVDSEAGGEDRGLGRKAQIIMEFDI